MTWLVRPLAPNRRIICAHMPQTLKTTLIAPLMQISPHAAQTFIPAALASLWVYRTFIPCSLPWYPMENACPPPAKNRPKDIVSMGITNLLSLCDAACSTFGAALSDHLVMNCSRSRATALQIRSCCPPTVQMRRHAVQTFIFNALARVWISRTSRPLSHQWFSWLCFVCARHVYPIKSPSLSPPL